MRMFDADGNGSLDPHEFKVGYTNCTGCVSVSLSLCVCVRVSVCFVCVSLSLPVCV
jgi:hypothetical protein